MKKNQDKIIYGKNEDKSIKKGELVYDPVAGLTIKDALARAIIMAKKANTHVHAIINDVHMHINPDTPLILAQGAYKKIADAQYQAALCACVKMHKSDKQA